LVSRLLLVSVPVFADGDEDDDDDKRKLSVKVSGRDVEIDSESEADTKNKFKFRLSTKDNGLKAEVESEVQDQDTKDKSKLTVYFQSIVQYDGEATPVYSGGATVGNSYDLSKEGWGDFSCPQDTTTGKYTCTATTSDGVFGAKFEFSGTAFQTGGMSLEPDDIKITLLINNFPYDSKAPAKTRLAVSAFGQAKVQYQEKDDSGKTKTVNTGASAFSWNDRATADSVDVNVANSPITFTEDSSDKKFAMWFSFEADKPKSIEWDPTLSTEDSGAFALVPCLTLFALIALFLNM